MDFHLRQLLILISFRHTLHILFYSAQKIFTRFPANNRLHNFLLFEKLITSVQLFPPNNEFLLARLRSACSLCYSQRKLSGESERSCGILHLHPLSCIFASISLCVSSNKQRLREKIRYIFPCPIASIDRHDAIF